MEDLTKVIVTTTALMMLIALAWALAKITDEDGDR